MNGNVTTALVTGANTGIGFQIALALVSLGWRVLLACRSPERAAVALEQLRAAPGKQHEPLVLELDLLSLSSVRQCAAHAGPVHVLVCNAGIMGAPEHFSHEGYEGHFAANHLGHFLLAELLEQRGAMRALVVLASRAHLRWRREALDLGPGVTEGPRIVNYQAMEHYGLSKLANVLHAAEFARRHPHVWTASLHPGLVKTELLSKVGWEGQLTPEEGAQTAVWLCREHRALPTGRYWYERQEDAVRSPLSLSEEAARELWDYSVKAVEKIAE